MPRLGLTRGEAMFLTILQTDEGKRMSKIDYMALLSAVGKIERSHSRRNGKRVKHTLQWSDLQSVFRSVLMYRQQREMNEWHREFNLLMVLG